MRGRTAPAIISIVLAGLSQLTPETSDGGNRIGREHAGNAVTQQPTAVAMNYNYVVSTTGNDNNNGTAAQPFRTIAKALSVAGPANVILVKIGTYHESLNLTRSGAAGQPIVLMGETAAGVVLDGTGLASVIVADGASYITMQNITVRYCANGPQNYQAAVRTGDNWTLQDMVIESVDGTGLCAKGSNVTILRVTSQDNGVAGIGADGANNLLVKDSITRRNNRGLANPWWKNQTNINGYQAAMQINGLWYMNPDFEAGGGKYWTSSNVTIDGLTADDNTGPGIWFDYRTTNVAIRNCKVFSNLGIDSSSHAYQGNGIRVEMQDQGPYLIENNLVYYNSGQSISISRSKNITIRNNTLVNGGILFRDYSTDPQYAVYNISITGNQIKNGFIETWEGIWNTTSGITKRISIDGNTYDDPSGPLFRWAGTDYTTLASVQSFLGFEASGKTGTITVILSAAILMVNDGSVQRSMVNSLTVTFDQPVTLASGALALIARGQPVAFGILITPSADFRTFRLTFGGPGVIGGSVPDGLYTLTIRAASVTDANNQPLAGGDLAFAFHRLFGDVNGDRSVTSADLAAFKAALNRPAAYLWYLDYDGLGTVDNADYIQLRARLNRQLL